MQAALSDSGGKFASSITSGALVIWWRKRYIQLGVINFSCPHPNKSIINKQKLFFYIL
jgi:hypothetical protein